jgi:hypothetical protein
MNTTCKSVVVVGVVAASLILLGACRRDHAPTSEANQPLSSRLVGEWKSDPFVGQLGESTETYCFGSDGSVSAHTETQAGAMNNRGTYQLAGDRVTVSWPDPGASAVMTVSWSGEHLVLTDDSQKSREYHRTSKRC